MKQVIIKQILVAAILCVVGWQSLTAQTEAQAALWDAIERDDYKAVKASIKQGVAMNEIILQKDPSYAFFISRDIYLQNVGQEGEKRYIYMTPLQFAALKNRFKIAKYMLKKGANLDAGDSQGKVALMYALWQPGGEEMALYFLKKGANYIARDEVGNTALHYAALGGNPEGIHMTYGGGISVNDRNQEGVTPFLAAAQVATPSILQQLADMGADIRAKDSVGMNAAHYAAGTGNTEGLKWLVEHGVDVNAVADNGYSVLDIAVLANHTANAEYLKSLGLRFHLWRYDELLSATQKGATGEVRNLLAAGVNPNCQSKDYPAHIAARNGDVTTLEWLVKGGADPSKVNAAGLCPFQEAMKSGSAGSAIVLLENGCEVRDAWLPELLEVWSKSGVKSSWEELIRRYLEKVVQKDELGGTQNLTALQYAAWAGSPEMVTLLLNAGANATARDEKGWTALHWNSVGMGEVVADAKRVQVADALLHAGAKATDETEKPRKRQEDGKPTEFYPPKASALDVLDNSLVTMPQLEAYLSQRSTPRNLTVGDYLAIGNEHLAAKDFTLAIRDFSRAITTNANAGEAYIGRAKALQAQKLHAEALRDLTIAVKKMPQSAEAWYLLAISQFELKNNKEAYKSAKTAVELDESMKDAYWYKGQAALANGDKVEACNSLADGANKGSDRCRESYKIHCQR